MQSTYRIAGIDVHKKMLAVVLAGESNDELWFEREQFGAGPGELRRLREWWTESGAKEVVMESTAQ